MSYSNPRPVVFTRNPLLTGNERPSFITPKQVSRGIKDLVVVEIQDKIIIQEGIKATAILAKALTGDYKHTLHWPVIQNSRINGYGMSIVVLSDPQGIFSLIKGEKAQEIISGNVPEGFKVEFFPPRSKRK